MANSKCEIHVYVFLKKLLHSSEQCKIVLTFDANSNVLNFTEKLKTESGKYRVNMITWSFLPFAICHKHNSKSLQYCFRFWAAIKRLTGGGGGGGTTQNFQCG